MAQALKQLHQGYRFQSPTMNLGAKPNVYKRSLEARENTNAYLAEVERKAAGLDEPTSQRTERLATYLTAGIVIALVLFAIGLRVL